MTDSQRDLLLMGHGLGRRQSSGCSASRPIFALAPWACVFQMKARFISGLVTCSRSGVSTGSAGLFAMESPWCRISRPGSGTITPGPLMALAGIVFSVGFAIVVICTGDPGTVCSEPVNDTGAASLFLLASIPAFALAHAGEAPSAG